MQMKVTIFPSLVLLAVASVTGMREDEQVGKYAVKIQSDRAATKLSMYEGEDETAAAQQEFGSLLLSLARHQAEVAQTAPVRSIGKLADGAPAWNLAQAACGEYCASELQASLQSLIAQWGLDSQRGQGHALNVRVFVGNECVDSLSSWASDLSAGPLKLAERTDFALQIYSIDAIKHFGNSVDLFKKCASARLWVPLVLPHLESLLYLDSDTRVVSSLAHLFEAFDKSSSPGAVFGMAENMIDCTDCGWYSKPDGKGLKAGKNGMNSGVLMMRPAKYIALNLAEKFFELMINHQHPYFILGDQDLLNYFLRQNPEWLTILPCEANVRRDTNTECKARAGGANHPYVPIVLHGNRALFQASTVDDAPEEVHQEWKKWGDKIADVTTSMLHRSGSLSYDAGENIWAMIQ